MPYRDLPADEVVVISKHAAKIGVALLSVLQVVFGSMMGWGLNKLAAIEANTAHLQIEMAVMTDRVARNDAIEKQCQQNRSDIVEIRALLRNLEVTRLEAQK